MLESEIPLNNIQDINFVRHHSKRCSIDPKTCPERGHDKGPAAARFLAGVCGNRLLGSHPSLWLTEARAPKRVLTDAWEELQNTGRSP